MRVCALFLVACSSVLPLHIAGNPSDVYVQGECFFHRKEYARVVALFRNVHFPSGAGSFLTPTQALFLRGFRLVTCSHFR